MNGELAQAIALAAHGSAWLGGRTGPAPPPLETSNSTFQFVRAIRFGLAGSFMKSAIESASVEEWLVALQKRQIARIWLATGEQAPWFLIATPRKGDAEVWRATWTVDDAEAVDRRIWGVRYAGRRDSKVEVPRLNPADAQARLATALEEAETFAREQGVDEWSAVFSAAARLGDVVDPVPPFHPDMFPATAFGRAARRLLAMATRAYVFGGMGSWNDVGFATPEATESSERITRELHAAVLDAFVAAANGSLDR